MESNCRKHEVSPGANNKALQVLSGSWNLALRRGSSRAKSGTHTGPILSRGLAGPGFEGPPCKGEPGTPSTAVHGTPLTSGPASHQPCLPGPEPLVRKPRTQSRNSNPSNTQSLCLSPVEAWQSEPLALSPQAPGSVSSSSSRSGRWQYLGAHPSEWGLHQHLGDLLI